MNFSRQSPAQSVIGSSSRLLAGYVLVSIGVLLAAGGGSWDINNHLLNKPETFFAPPHAVLYAGVGAVVAGSAMLFIASRRTTMIRPIKLVIAGVVILVAAGPVDFVWHLAFGLDGLLSPPHFVLVSGMVASSAGALAGMIHHASMAFREFRLAAPLIVLGVLPVWLATSGMIDMFSLPFSTTPYFDFDPHPVLGVVVATLAFPILMSVLAYSSSTLAGRLFGIVTAVGAAFIATSMLSSIVPNDALIPTIPFYIVNIIPFVAADALLSFSRSRISLYAAGAIVGVAFFTLYYPLITYTYNEMLDGQDVWPSLIAPTYFKMLPIVMPFVIAPAAAMGIIGAVAGERLLAKNKAL